jgi:hypothetical protein
MKTLFFTILKSLSDTSCATRWMGIILLMALPVTNQAGELKVCNQIDGWVSFDGPDVPKVEHSGAFPVLQCRTKPYDQEGWIWINYSRPIPTWFNWESRKLYIPKCDKLDIWIKDDPDYYRYMAEVWCDGRRLADEIFRN